MGWNDRLGEPQLAMVRWECVACGETIAIRVDPTSRGGVRYKVCDRCQKKEDEERERLR